jgi:hypothetical protein
MPRANLRAVEPNEKRPPRALTVSQAAATGNHRELLVAMRERIAATVSNPDCPPRDLASLTRRLQDIAKEIEAIDLRAKEEGADAADVAADEDWDAASF